MALPILFDYAEILEVIGPEITNPGHRLCLWLIFHLGLRANDLIDLPKDPELCLQKCPQFSENTRAALQTLLMSERHKALTNNVQLLFETNGRPFSVLEMRNFIWRLVSKYSLEAIFRKQFCNMAAQTELEKTTREQYESHFITFIRAMRYRNPASIETTQIRGFLHYYGKERSAETQNAMINALRFYYRYCLK